MSEYTFIKSYTENEELRRSLCDLAKRTFWIDLEAWYQNGFWTGNHKPYSMVKDGQVVANVLVSEMTFDFQGEES